MTSRTIPQDVVQGLVEAGREFARRGWVPATAGNFSVRLDAQTLAITVSGRHKGELRPEDIMLADPEGRPLSPGKRSSAETGLHTQLYRRDARIGAVLHVHSANATVLSKVYKGALRLRDYEVLKAFPGIDSHETRVDLPIFPNDQDIERLARHIDAYMDAHGPLIAYMIEGHGCYTWGASLADAYRHVEALEFLLECEVLIKRMGV